MGSLSALKNLVWNWRMKTSPESSKVAYANNPRDSKNFERDTASDPPPNQVID